MSFAKLKFFMVYISIKDIPKTKSNNIFIKIIVYIYIKDRSNVKRIFICIAQIHFFFSSEISMEIEQRKIMKREEVDTEENDNQLPLQEEEQETEEEMSGRTIEPWTKQITVRGVLVSIVIGVVFSVIAQKLNLTTGIVPNLNSSAALLAFVFVQTWTKILKKSGFVSKPFTRQENTMIQTSAVACYGIAVGG